MTINNVRIVLPNRVLKGSISFENGIITNISEHEICDKNAINGNNLILMPGFIDVHIHGSNNIDFMDANAENYKTIANSLYAEGVTSFLATTLTSDKDSLKKVCLAVKEAKGEVPSLLGIHFEGPYINLKYKGAQNPDFIRDPNLDEFNELQRISGNNIRYISLAPEKEGAMNFINTITKNGVVASAGHTDATFKQVEEAINNGLTNTTHTHNAMSGHHHRNAGVVTAAFNFDELYTEFICDTIHVSPESLKTSYKIIGPDRFMIITDALKIKHSNVDKFELFGLECERKNGAAYLCSGPLAGSLLTMDQAIRNMRDICGCSLSELSKISSKNAAKSLKIDNIGEIKVGNLADFVLLNDELKVIETYKKGVCVYHD